MLINLAHAGNSHLLLKHIPISKTVMSPLPLLGGPGGTPQQGPVRPRLRLRLHSIQPRDLSGDLGGVVPSWGCIHNFSLGSPPQDDCPTKLNLVKNPIKNQPTSALSSTAGWEIFIYDNLHQGGGRQVDSKTPNLHKNLKRNLFLFIFVFYQPIIFLK